jgi:exodeoxyribonuclease VII large subunit
LTRRAVPGDNRAMAAPRSSSQAGLFDAQEPWTVSGLTRAIHKELEGFGRLVVSGELSGLKQAASGHIYFDLKDESARISCVVWKSQVARAARSNPKEGDRVLVHGKLDVYAPRGSYSLVVERLEPLGLGALLEKFEKLKAELAARGWFNRKRPLPPMPRCIGVVTSRDGAALRDFLRTRSLRWRGYPLRLCHTPVQGPGSAEAIAAAIRALAASGVDLLVVTRGGGSLEDLWAFNEEPVARAIYECPVPVISAVGHETDVTLADFVADHRAHTPTDAAQSAIPERAALLLSTQRAGLHLAQAIDRLLERRGERLARLAQHPALNDPGWSVDQRAQMLAALGVRAQAALEQRRSQGERRLAEVARRIEPQSPARRVARLAQRVAALEPALHFAARTRLQRAEQRQATAAARLEAISPLAVLARGYSLVRRADGQGVRSSADLVVGEQVDVTFATGAARARIEDLSSPG